MKSKDIQNLSSDYGVDIVGELESILSNEIAKEIDKDILRNLGLEPDRWKRRKNSINKIFPS